MAAASASAAQALRSLAPPPRPELLSLNLPRYDPARSRPVDLAVMGGGPAGLAVAQRVAEVMLNFLKDFENKLADGSGEPFFVLNSVVISEYPFAELIQFHKSHGSEATIMVTKVDEPSKYGVVVTEEETGKVERFVEKPKVLVGNKVNAGIRLINPSVLDPIELKPTSIKKEVFPRIVVNHGLFAMVLLGFWMDIGQPRDYIAGLRLYLDSLRKKAPAKLASGTHVLGNVLVHETAVIGEGCLIGLDVAIRPGCVVEAGVRLSRCTVMRGIRVKTHACISGNIVGWHFTVGKWARVENMTILGEDVHVCDEVYSNGGVVLQHGNGYNTRRAKISVPDTRLLKFIRYPYPFTRPGIVFSRPHYPLGIETPTGIRTR